MVIPNAQWRVHSWSCRWSKDNRPRKNIYKHVFPFFFSLFVEQSNILRPFMCLILSLFWRCMRVFILFLSVSEILNQHSTPTESNRSTISFTHRWGIAHFIVTLSKFNKLHQWNATLMLLLCWFLCHFNDIFINYKIHSILLIHNSKYIWSVSNFILFIICVYVCERVRKNKRK